jgi:aspartate/methionine/tyrosine aminotransferase
MISPELMSLLEPLERFELIRRRVVRLGDRLCDLSYANPYEGAQEDAKQAIRAALDDERPLGLQYSPFGGQTLARRAVADSLRADHGLAFTFSDIVLTPGAMAALQLTIRVSGEPGDEIIVPVPCWLDYPLYAHYLGFVPVLVPLEQGTFDLDPQAIGRAVSPRTCAVLLSNPNNPTGRNASKNVLQELACTLHAAEERTKRSITVIADETHRDFTLKGQFSPLVEFVDRTMVIYSFGKRHFMQGQRLGYVGVSPRHPERRDVSEELVRWTRITGIATPTALMQRAIPSLLALEGDATMSIAMWRHRMRTELSLLGYVVVDADATMFLYVQTPPGRDDFSYIEDLATEGVLALPAPCFHHEGYFRLALTASESMLHHALQIFNRLRPEVVGPADGG